MDSFSSSNGSNKPDKSQKKNEIIIDDCFKVMKKFPDNSFDMILTDPPYNVTALEWDTAIDLDKLFKELNRIIKPKGNIVMTSQQPFTTDVINANRKFFRFETIWDKSIPANFMNRETRPLKIHENILIFYQESGTYNPQKVPKNQATIRKLQKRKKRYEERVTYEDTHHKVLNFQRYVNVTKETYPHSIIYIPLEKGNQFVKKVFHGTQKPIDLFTYLIRTYSNENDIILDCFAGALTTHIASILTNRLSVSIEIDKKTVIEGKKRVKQVLAEKGKPTKSLEGFFNS